MKSMKKKIFPILTVLLIPVNCILGIMLYLFEIVNFYDGIGEIIYSTACIIGALGAPIGILGVIAGFILRRKGRKKAGMIIPLLGVIIQVTILAGFLILDYTKDDLYSDGSLQPLINVMKKPTERIGIHHLK